jgi:hypothetical protein
MSLQASLKRSGSGDGAVIPKLRGRTCSCGETSCQVNRAQVERDVMGHAADSDALIEVLSSGGDRTATLHAQSAAEQSCAGVVAAMPARRMDSDVVSIEGLPVAPWVPLMLSLTFQSVQGGRLRMDRCIKAISWVLMGKPTEEVGDSSHPLPPPPPIEWQMRSAPHNHTCPTLLRRVSGPLITCDD